MLKYVVSSLSDLLDYCFANAVNPPDSVTVSGQFQNVIVLKLLEKQTKPAWTTEKPYRPHKSTINGELYGNVHLWESVFCLNDLFPSSVLYIIWVAQTWPVIAHCTDSEDFPPKVPSFLISNLFHSLMPVHHCRHHSSSLFRFPLEAQNPSFWEVCSSYQPDWVCGRSDCIEICLLFIFFCFTVYNVPVANICGLSYWQSGIFTMHLILCAKFQKVQP